MLQSQTSRGLFLALSAFTIWGLFTPAYFKWVGFAHPVEILCHRVVWSIPICAWLLSRRQGWAEVRQVVKHPKTLLILVITSLTVAFNWGLYIWAMIAGYVLQGSLGYYIVPLLSVLAGVVFLQERLSRLQLAAVLIATAGTLTLTVVQGELPWIALLLAGSFVSYGILRKTVAMSAIGGLFVETLLLLPLTLAYLIWLWSQGELALISHGLVPGLLLVMAGLVTTVPLLCYTQAARLLRFSTVGICQYWSPTLMFILAVFVYREPFTYIHLFTFVCIWLGCGLYVGDSFINRKKG